MKFQVKIQNCSKLKNEEFSISNFTVLAGPNNTGKSFVSKILYSIFKALRADHARSYLSQQISKLEMEWTMLSLQYLDLTDDSIENFVFETLKAIKSLIASCSDGNSEELDITVSRIVSHIDELLEVAEQNRPELRENKRRKSRKNSSIQKLVPSLTQTRKHLTELSMSEIIFRGIKVEIEKKFRGNFQTASISQLAHDESQPTVIDIENIGRFIISDGETTMHLCDTWRESVLPFSRLIFIESPISDFLTSAE